MQYSVMLEQDYSGNIKMKTINNYKNPYKKEPNLDNIVDQLCTRLQDIKDQEGVEQVGMPTCSIEQAEAVRRYYAAFPALKKGRESPLQYYLPPPAWCRKPESDFKIKMQSELPIIKELNVKNKKFSTGKERRNSYHGQRKNGKKRCNSQYSKSFENQESLPEWVTHEGVWDMETQDPVKEFIRAIALDEGYGTCENTVTDEIKEITQVRFRMADNMVPDWENSLDLEAEWVVSEDLNQRVRSPVEDEMYAKFEAKFDRSIEALWSKDQNTPDDEYQDLPIDFQDLLSSPSDHMFADPSAEKCSLISLTESIWSNEGFPVERGDSPSRMADALHDRFRPLNLADPEPAPAPPPAPRPREIDSFSLYEGDDFYDALSTVANTMRSYTAINHSRDSSGFVEVPPRRHTRPLPVLALAPALASAPEADPRRTVDREDLLTAERTHFKPIRREPDTERYADGDTFDIRGDLDPVHFHRSDSGGLYSSSLERYLEYRASKSIDYGRLNLTPAQRCPDLDDPGFRLRFPVRQIDAAVQTDRPPDEWGSCECGHAAKKMRSNAIDMDGIWGEACEACGPVISGGVGGVRVAPAAEELSREWEELVSDISAAHAQYASASAGGGGGGEAGEEALVSADRKRRHSAALRCGAPCSHPHARFLHCCVAAFDRPLTR